MKINILGVRINQISLAEIIIKIDNWVMNEPQQQIATVNPEFIVAAQKNKDFRATLNQVDLAICDGIGLVLASRFLTGKKLMRVTGVDIVEKIISSKLETQNLKLKTQSLNLNANQKLKIYLLGSSDEIIELMKNKYPDSNIVGGESGGKLLFLPLPAVSASGVKGEKSEAKRGWKNWQLEDNEETIQRIKNSEANILLVAFGQIKQEMWIANNLQLMLNIKVAIGVGGTFDYLSGKIKRAPKWMRSLGLEWLFRLLYQPSRAGRIINATLGFSWLILKNKIKK